MKNGRQTRRKTKRERELEDDIERFVSVARHDERELGALRMRVRELEDAAAAPIPLFLTCPGCNGRHIDEGVFATKVHTTHACQHCGLTWRPAIVPTVGVQFLPGFRNTP